MKLRVKASATKGHWVGNRLVAPGEVLPGDYPAVPASLAYKLEAVEEAPAPAAAGATQSSSEGPAHPPPEAEASANGEADADWYKALSKTLGKAPTKAQLADYASNAFGVTLDPAEMDKAAMIAEITRLYAEDAASSGVPSS